MTHNNRLKLSALPFLRTERQQPHILFALLRRNWWRRWREASLLIHYRRRLRNSRPRRRRTASAPLVVVVMMVMVRAFTDTALIAAVIRLWDKLLDDRATDYAGAENQGDGLRQRVDVIAGFEVVVGDGCFDGSDKCREDGDVEKAAQEMHVEDMRRAER